MGGRKHRVELHEPAHARLLAAASRRFPVETGGILVGYRQAGTIVVTDIIEVLDRTASNLRYTGDDVLANELLNDWLSQQPEGSRDGYVGEWHSHVGGRGTSNVDFSSATAIARKAQGPIALIVGELLPTPGMEASVLAKSGLLRRVTVDPAEICILAEGTPPLPDGAIRIDGPVFISYRQNDGTERSAMMADLLRSAGLVVWRDRSDLIAGTTRDRLDQALTGGLSGAVLVVTKDIENSSVVREIELPRLLQLDASPGFSLCIANEVEDTSGTGKPDFRAPDALLGTGTVLGDKKQCNSRTTEGRLEIVRDLLMHRIQLLRPDIRKRGRLTVLTQTRPEPSATDADSADLCIRLRPGTSGRLPEPGGLECLQQTLPLTADAIFAARPAVVRIEGGMHLSVALAVGAALPETRVGELEVVDTAGEVWKSELGEDPGLHHLKVVDLGSAAEEVDGPVRVAVLVTLAPNPDQSAFARLVGGTAGNFAAAIHIGMSVEGRIDPREAGRLSREVAHEIRSLSATWSRAEVHLAFQGPYGMAVLVGRLLNTISVVVYEWESLGESGPAYHPTLLLRPGTAAGPIADVLL